MAVSAIFPSVLYSPAPQNKRDGTISAASRVSLDGFLKKASSNHQGAFWGKSGEQVFLT